MAEPGYLSYEAYDKQGKDVTLFSADGSRKPESAYAKAIDTYNESGQAPEGFVVGKPGEFMHGLRSSLISAREGLAKVGTIVGAFGASSPLLMGLERAGLVPGGNQAALQDIGAQTGRQVADVASATIASPEALGATIGAVAGGRLAAPVTTVNPAGQVGTAGRALWGNAIRTGLLGATGGQVGRMMGGEDPTVGSALVRDFLPAALGQGFTGVLDRFMTKYLTPNMREEVAKGVLGEIADAYPAYKNDPQLINAALKSSKGLENATKKMSGGLRGSLDETTNQLFDDIKYSVPVGLSQGEQVTLRANIRHLNNAGSDVLDNLVDNAKYNKALDGFIAAKQAIYDFIDSKMPQGQTLANQATMHQVDRIIMRYEAQLKSFEEGAQVLGYLRKSGAHEGFDPEAFAQAMVGQDQPGSLLEKVSRQLGFGQPISRPIGTTPTQDAAQLGAGLLEHIPGKIGTLAKIARMLGSKQQPSMLPWQTMRATGTLTPAAATGAFMAGSDAIKDYVGRSQRR